MSYGKFTKSCVISCNVSYKDKIDAETLVGILSGEHPIGERISHIDTFFNELPKDFIIGVMQENDLSMHQLSKVFGSLPHVFQGNNFKRI